MLRANGTLIGMAASYRIWSTSVAGQSKQDGEISSSYI